MRRCIPALVLVALTVGCSDFAESPMAPVADGASRIDPVPTEPPGQDVRYIVVLNTPAGPTVTTSVTSTLGVTPDLVYEHAITGFVATLTPGQLLALQSDPQVAWIEEDKPVSIGATQTPTPSWGLDRTDQNNLPLDDSYTYNATGSGVTFYSVDTGVRATHNDFGGRVGPGVTYINDGRGTDDCHGHGTHTSSTAAGATYGIAKGMDIVPVRVLDCNGSGFTSGVIAGVDWIRNNATLPAVANMSLGGGFSPSLDAAVANAVGAGITFSVSAGNSNGNACFQSPAREASALTVASTTITDQRSGFSNFGSCVDLFAPGSGITAAWANSDTGTNTISGTSMAAPHVAGVVGLYLELNPGATPAQVGTAILGNATAGVVGNPGSGSPNLLLYSGFIGGGPPPPPPPNQPPVADFTYDCTGLTCDFDGTGSTDDNGIASYLWTDAGGGVIGTTATFSHTFPSAGSEDVTLRVEDGAGLFDTQTQTVTVTDPPPPPPGNQPPVADFTWSCDASRTCTFDGTSSTDDVGVVGWEWLTGGTVRATGSVVVKQFFSNQTFDLTLRVTDGGGLTGEQTQTVDVAPGSGGGPPPGNQPPVADFTFSCTDLTCDFDASSSSDDQGVVTWIWTDPSLNVIGLTETFTHTFGTAGSYAITLTVGDAGGLGDVITKTVTVTNPPPPPPPNQPPVASFTYSCTDLTCDFDGTGSSDDNGISSYTWTDGAGAVLGTGALITHTFASAGTEDVTLTVADAGGLDDSQTQSVTVTDPPPPPPPGNQPPVADFTWSCDASRLCTFDATSSTDDGGITSYEWIVGGSVRATGAVVTNQFYGPTTLQLTLRVTDGGGLQDTQQQTVSFP